MKEADALVLLKKYIAGSCTEEERAMLENWYLQWNDQDMDFKESELMQLRAEMWKVMPRGTTAETVVSERTEVTRRSLWSRITAAAAVLLVAGLSIFFYNRYTNTARHLEGSAATRDLLANNIKPGSNKAYLVLSNGKRLSLTDAANGELAKEAGVEITKTTDGQVVYAPRTNYSNALNTIETPRGGQYQIVLPDGSKVWLNAASKLIYPVSFNGRGQRVVELSGEAYFEIFKNKLQPFVVKSKNQEVTVLGTHFNINSYSDEPGTKTTLLEGSVKVNEAVLKPGEQAILINNNIQVTQVDTELALAWKNNKFIFEQDNIQYIMRMIERWYNVDIIYTGPPPSGKFGGSMSKYENIEEVLKPLQSTGKVKFKIEGRKIYVTR